MPRFAANLSFMFPELPFVERFAAARRCGFDAVEFLFPYDFPAETIGAQLQAHALTLVLHNVAPGDWAGGERGIACHPGRRQEFEAGVDQALAYARALQVRQLHCLAGLLAPGADRDAAHACYVDNLRHAAARFASDGITLLIEPINTFDMPGYFLTSCDQAAAVIAEVGAPNLFMQCDLYHVARMGQDVSATLRRHLPLIRHMQVADVPGRHEPGSGTMAYPELFDLVDQLGYSGWIGCEYHPLADTAAGLAWMRSLRA